MLTSKKYVAIFQFLKQRGNNWIWVCWKMSEVPSKRTKHPFVAKQIFIVNWSDDWSVGFSKFYNKILQHCRTNSRYCCVFMCMFIICEKVSFCKNKNQDGIFLSSISAFFFSTICGFFVSFFVVVFFLIYFYASYSLCHILQIKKKIQLFHCNHKDALTALFSKGKMMLVSWFFCLL